MLVDNITLTIKAGNGGNGAATLLRNGMTAKGGPDGGNGGNGGSIYFEGSNNISDLRQFRYKKKLGAEDGTSGRNKRLFGKNGEDLTIYVPLGTQITDKNTNESWGITQLNKKILVAQGGQGGRGNNEFKSATDQTPLYAEDGTPGDEKELFLELKIIADIGLIGLPNAGKSSLLALLTNANPKIGDYPFTTLEPNIGMLDNHAIADIPGLIEGASSGKGLGVTFLKHIEKTKLLVHCIDSTNLDLEKTYITVRNEFSKFNTELTKKPEIILFTKTDLIDEKTITSIYKKFSKKNKTIWFCSMYKGQDIAKIKDALLRELRSNDDS